MEPIFFRTGAEFGEWLREHDTAEREVLVGFYKKDSIEQGIKYAEALDQALCHGWIDGVRRRVDGDRFSIRFTPRKERSIWSAVNIKRATELVEAGLMRPAGLEAFNRRDPAAANKYSYEARERSLTEAQERQFRENAAAWAFFESQPPYYQKSASWYVISALKEETREKRLAELISHCEAGERLPQITYTPKEKGLSQSK